jgi:hypothetical protein
VPINSSEITDPRRLQQLETLLRWEGRLNNARIRELFGLSSPRASVWIRRLRESHPDWVQWDTISRSFLATPEAYSPTGASGTLDQYIGLTGLSAAVEALGTTSAMQAAFPALAAPPPAIFGALNRAIQAAVPVEILYASMRHPERHWRVIHPHRLVRTEQRWHVRAYCDKNQDFRDFNLGRIREVSPLDGQPAVAGSEDHEWQTLLEVRFVAHPDLPPSQKRVVRDEYFCGASGRAETCRAPLLHYFIRSVQAAIDPDRQTPPEHVLAVLNAETLTPWLMPA